MVERTMAGDRLDTDPDETRDWLESLDAALKASGKDRARFLLAALEEHAQLLGLNELPERFSPYRNSIPVAEQPAYPGNLQLEERLTAIVRWNALAMVVRANQAFGELGGHISSYASVAEIFELGFNHYFRGPDAPGGGDLVYFQPHSSPGVYARAFLEGRLTEEQLQNYRREQSGPGLCSYPHPWLMPDFWQVPTGSMGIGPLNAIYQARFMRYLRDRGLVDTDARHVWGVFGDGEMDEPESLAGLSIAAREGLDNLTFVINCNLQRLDGPVRGNGQIILELERLFRGAGWNVIKVLWGSEWDHLFAMDSENLLLQRFSQMVDGEYQTLGAKDGAYNLANFFSSNPELKELVSHLSDDDIDGLKRGGHDFRKLNAAFARSLAKNGKPTVILAKTKKGFGMGGAGESRMTAHQSKKLDPASLYEYRDRFGLALTDQQARDLEFVTLAADSPELRYLRERREQLGGYLPARRQKASQPLTVPPLDAYADFALEADGKTMSTTVAAVRLLSKLLKDSELGPRLVPIVADEARTFGMASLFRQIGIYSHCGQLYQPEDAESLLVYREARDGQLLEEGISEAGALSSWAAAATAYSVHDYPMLPVYIFYSMFGFQRVGDLIWAAADQRARGFLIGATAGRTTLSGEGLQHQDGSSLCVAATVPNCRSYDPAFGYELAVIFDRGARRMLSDEHDEFYYITAMNEAYPNPSMPKGVDDDIMRGIYRLSGPANDNPDVRLLGSGAILQECIAAAETLRDAFSLNVDVYSVTSYAELTRDAQAHERATLFSAAEPTTKPHVAKMLPGRVPTIAATDYVRALPQMIAPYIDGRYVCLGTDGFGRSDTREALRAFFEVDHRHIAAAALAVLVDTGTVPSKRFAKALSEWGIDATATEAPWAR